MVKEDMDEQVFKKHLEDVKEFLKAEGINPETDLSKEFIKQVKLSITNFYEIQKLKEEIKELRKIVKM